MSWATRGRGQAVDERVRIANGRDRNDESVEVIVIMFAFGVVMRRASAQIVLGRSAHAEQDIGADGPLACGRDLHRTRQGSRNLRTERV